MAKLLVRWCVRGMIPYRVQVYETAQQRPNGLPPIKVYKDRGGHTTYSARYIKTWAELTVKQKADVYRAQYQADIEDARWQIAKDPDLKSQFPVWKKDCQNKRDAAIAALERGEDVQPPEII